MNCPRCNTSINMQMNRCSQCGQSIQVYKKTIRISNSLYNEGLERARVRNLSGAVEVLKKSLTYYKRNTDARNLLGLIYYEMGEIVDALSQWIISKSLCEENNEADYYIESIQSNPQMLENAGLTIKKYNAALVSAKQGNEDLAIIQLKKVVSLFPNFVRGQQLMALMYIIVGEERKALIHLRKAQKIDINNTLTNRYINMLGESVKQAEDAPRNVSVQGDRKIFKGDVPVAIPVIQRENKKNKYFPIASLVAGIVIGILVGVALIMPGMTNKYNKEKAAEVTDYGEKLADKDSRIQSLEYEKENLQGQIDELEEQLAEANKDESMSVAEVYEKILKAYKDYSEGNKSEALAAVVKIDMTGITSKVAKEIVEVIQSEDAVNASAEVFEKGRVAYNNGSYDEAKKYFDESLQLNKDNYDTLYFYGRLNHKQGKKEEAEKYYRKVIDEFPDSPRASEAKARLSELGIAVN